MIAFEEDGNELRHRFRSQAELTHYFDYYNDGRRPHSTLAGKIPDTAYFSQSLLVAVA